MGVNNCLSLSAVGKHAKAKHDVARFGKRPCSWYPYCDVVFSGGEDIGKIRIHEPANHTYAGTDSWACWHHVQACLDGMEAQDIRRRTRRTRNSAKEQAGGDGSTSKKSTGKK